MIDQLPLNVEKFQPLTEKQVLKLSKYFKISLKIALENTSLLIKIQI